MWSRDFCFRLVVEDENVRPKYRRNGRNRRQRYMASFVRRLSTTPCDRPIPVEWDFDTWAYRTEGDRGYVANLRRLLDNIPERVEEPAIAYMAWDKLILPLGFKRYVERESNPRYYEKLKYGRWMRNALGVFVAYEWIEATTFEPRSRYEWYPQIPHWFSQYEVPADFVAEVPPFLVYFGLSLNDSPQSPRWMIFLSEWIAIVAKRFIWSSVDGRLYVLPTMVVKWIRKLDLEGILGGSWVCEQLDALLDIHDRFDWPRVPYSQGHHYDRVDRANASPGRRDDVGDSRAGNWIRFDREAFVSLQPEFMQGVRTR